MGSRVETLPSGDVQRDRRAIGFKGAWLYDLEIDPTESDPMNLHHPELVARFTRDMDAWQEDMEADREGFKGGSR